MKRLLGIVAICVIFMFAFVEVSEAGVYYVVHRLMRQADGTFAPSDGASFLFQPGSKPSALDFAKESAAEEAKKADVVKVWIVKEGEGESTTVEANGKPNLISGESLETNDLAATQPIGPVDASDPDAVLARVNQRLRRTRRTVQRTLGDVARVRRNDVRAAIERVRRFSGAHGEIVGDNYRASMAEVNGLVSDYNKVANELGNGSLADSFRDLKEMQPMVSGVWFTPKASQERALTIQAKLEEISLRLGQRELTDAKETLEIERQRLATDKAKGIDVSEREKALSDAVAIWKEGRSELQKEADGYSQDQKQLETVRAQVKEEKRVAERMSREEERRKQEAIERAAEQEKLAEERRREEALAKARAEKERVAAFAILRAGHYTTSTRSGRAVLNWDWYVSDDGTVRANVRGSNGSTGGASGVWKVVNQRVMLKWEAANGDFEVGKWWLDITDKIKGWKRVGD